MYKIIYIYKCYVDQLVGSNVHFNGEETVKYQQAFQCALADYENASSFEGKSVIELLDSIDLDACLSSSVDDAQKSPEEEYSYSDSE